MSTINLLTGQISEIVSISPGTRITSSGNGSIQWTPGSLSDAKNNATWTTWAKGSAAGYMDVVRQMCIRATATGAMTVTIEEGRNDKYGEDAYFEEDTPYLSTDSNGNTVLVGADGLPVGIQNKATNGNLVKQRIARATAVRSNASTARSEQVAYAVRKKALAVRFGIEGYHSATVPVDLCKFTSVATSDDFPSASAGTWTNVTFSGNPNGVVPALVATNRPGLLLSDWIDCSVDAGSYLVVRTLATGTNPFSTNYASYGITAAQLDALTELGVFGWGDLTDKVTTPSTAWNTTLAGAQSNLGIPYVEFLTEARTVAVCCVGDSTTVGQVDSGTVVVAPVHQACEELSSANVLYSPIVKGWGGSTSAQHYNIAIDVIANTPPDVLIYQAWSQNNSGTAGDAEMRYAMDIVNRCKAANIVPILLTGIPVNSWVTPTNDAVEAGRIALNARIRALEAFGALVIDADDVLSDDGSPAAYLAAYGSTTHPNDTGYAALTEEYKSVLRRVTLA